MDRTYHNLFSQVINGFSANDINAYMDRFSKSLRHSHRNVGHDVKTLLEMMVLFRHKYNPSQIFRAWMVHKMVDGFDSKFKKTVRKEHPEYGKKNVNVQNEVDKLKLKLIKEGILG